MFLLFCSVLHYLLELLDYVSVNRLVGVDEADYCLRPASSSTDNKIRLIPAEEQIKKGQTSQKLKRRQLIKQVYGTHTVSLCGNKSLCIRKKFFPNCLNPLINFLVSSSVHFLSMPFGTGHFTSACNALPGS